MEEVYLVAYALFVGIWFYAPAYSANAMASIIGKILTVKGWNKPVDLNKKWRDGRPILGPGKTWGGLIGGTLFGGIAGAIEFILYPFLINDVQSWMEPLLLVRRPELLIFRGFLLGLGALTGDIIKSFFKRRAGKQWGEFWFPFDQIDFILGSTLFALPFIWPLTIEIVGIFLIFVFISIPVHIIADKVAFKLKIKNYSH
ncbi:MAG: CDP-archaeol synthase [Candidatus Korarchaeota archaeon]